jgi:hypothetical protein
MKRQSEAQSVVLSWHMPEETEEKHIRTYLHAYSELLECETAVISNRRQHSVYNRD